MLIYYFSAPREYLESESSIMPCESSGFSFLTSRIKVLFPGYNGSFKYFFNLVWLVCNPCQFIIVLCLMHELIITPSLVLDNSY